MKTPKPKKPSIDDIIDSLDQKTRTRAALFLIGTVWPGLAILGLIGFLFH